MKLTKTGNKAIIELDLIPEGQEKTKTLKNWKAYSTQGFIFEQGLGISINIIHSKK